MPASAGMLAFQADRREWDALEGSGAGHDARILLFRKTLSRAGRNGEAARRP
jgi:hypothetical protein